VPFQAEPIPTAPLPTPQELKEFHDLLERAREYDRKNHEPHCALDEKRQALLDMAKALGVEINFL
jgi:hypothetical protein